MNRTELLGHVRGLGQKALITLAGTLLVAGVASAATTISTNIATGGSLSVGSDITLQNGESITNATDGVIGLNGDLSVGGFATTTAATGNFATRGTVTIGTAGTAIAGFLFGTCTVTPGAILATASTTATCTATGVAASDKVFVTAPNTFESWLRVEGATPSTNTITLQIQNASTTVSVTGAARTWSWMAVR